MAQSKSQLGPGAQLKQAREAAGRTVEDVASYLHLTTQVIDSIESDHYQDRKSVIPFTFVKGYLRSYAKFLQLDPEPLITAFDRLELVEPNTGRPALGLVRKPTSLRVNLTRWLTYFMIGLGLVVTIMWWYSYSSDEQVAEDSAPWLEVEANHTQPSQVEEHHKKTSSPHNTARSSAG